MVSRVVTIPQTPQAELALDIAALRAELPALAPTRLDELVVGPENATARVVLEGLIETLRAVNDAGTNIDVQPADGRFDRFQPLVLCGPTGSGKSAWVHALLRTWQHLRPAESLVLTTGADFAREFAEAIDRRQIVAWREMVRSAALVVIDDLTQFAEKKAAQIELCNALDELAERGGLAIVITRLPLARCREFLSAGLMSRLVSGVKVEMHLPEFDARQEILRRFAEQRRVMIAPNVLRILAQGVRGSVPELFSAVMTLERRLPASRLSGSTVRKIDAIAARQYVANVQEAKMPSLRSIAMHAARHFTLTINDLKSASRRQAIVQARDVAMYVARQLTGKSLEEIGRFFGNRDHTTVLHGCRKTEECVKSDPLTREAVEQVRAALIME